MPEIAFIIDDLRGAILVENNQDLSEESFKHLQENSGNAQEIA